MISVGLSIREHGGHVIVTLDGELDVVDAACVAYALTSAAAHNPRIILDLAALEFIDCCALGELVRVRVRARRGGGDLLLAAPGVRVRRTLTLIGMNSLFPIYGSLADAVRIADTPALCWPGGVCHPRSAPQPFPALASPRRVPGRVIQDAQLP